MNEEDKAETPSIETPLTRIIRHVRTLDDTLASIKGYSDESKIVRFYIIAQIEALDFAIRKFDA